MLNQNPTIAGQGGGGGGWKCIDGQGNLGRNGKD